uniref:Uncharacterized protein n=1 Tax=Solanum lycopersicum TaxID=4081 RepID=A0A3Q7IFF9_SOLLC
MDMYITLRFQYEGGMVTDCFNVDVDKLSYFKFVDIVKEMGYNYAASVVYIKPPKCRHVVEVKSDRDIMGIVPKLKNGDIVELYVIHLVEEDVVAPPAIEYLNDVGGVDGVELSEVFGRTSTSVGEELGRSFSSAREELGRTSTSAGEELGRAFASAKRNWVGLLLVVEKTWGRETTIGSVNETKIGGDVNGFATTATDVPGAIGGVKRPRMVGMGILHTQSGFTIHNDYLELSHDNRNDFDAYINQNTEPTEDILQWWRNRGKGFPKLVPMVRDILGMQASSVTSKGVFSATRFQLGEHRHSLAADSLEISVLFRDWINAERRNLGREPLPPNFKMTLIK